MNRPISFFALIFVFLLPFVAHGAVPTNEQIATSSEVLVVYNSNITTVSDGALCGSTQESLCIANYYKNARGIPSVNVLGIPASTTPSGAAVRDIDGISRADYNNGIKTPIENYLSTATSSDGALLKNKIKYIVLMRGVPLKINESFGLSNYKSSSVDTAVGLLFQTYNLIDSIDNPYFNVDPNLTGAYRFKQNYFSNGTVTLKYLVTRLDGYYVDDVKSMIDRSLAADTSGTKYFVIDPSNHHYGQGANANSTLTGLGFHTIYDNTGANINAAWVTASSTGSRPIIGYMGEGANAIPSPITNNTLYTSVLSPSLYANGAISSTYESFNARSLSDPADDAGGHNAVANFIHNGGSGALGHVYEPFLTAIGHEDIWMPDYAIGYTWADAAYMSLPYVDWENVVVGDPLMVISNKPFAAQLVAPLDGGVYSTTPVTFSWSNATGYYPIAKYQLYIDGSLTQDSLVATTTTVSSLSPGRHAWYIKAYDTAGQISISSTYTFDFLSSGSHATPSFIQNIFSSSSTIPVNYLSGPSGITTDSSGNVYVADSGNNLIKKFNSSGTLSFSFGSTGTTTGKFNTPIGVAVNSGGDIYVVDQGNSRVQKFNSAGVFQSTFGTYGSGNGQFNAPTNIGIDSSGNIYVWDTGNGRVEKFNSAGNYVLQWTWDYSEPVTMAFDPSGDAIVTDLDVGTQEFDNQGNYIRNLGTDGFPGSVATDALGNIFVVDAEVQVLREFDSAGNVVTDLIGGAVDSNSKLAVDSTGTIYLITGSTITKFDSSGNQLTQWGGAYPGGTGNGQFDAFGPYKAARDSSNNIYVLDPGNNRLEKFDSSGTFLTKWGSSGTGDGQFGGVVDLAIDSSNNVYVVDQGNSRIEKFDSSGTFLTKWGSNGTGNNQFSGPLSIAVDSLSNVYVGDQANKIRKFNSTGTFINSFGSGGTANGQFNNIISLATDSSNNLYLIDLGNERVQKFNSSGTFLTKWGGLGSGQGTFNFGNFGTITVDSGNNLYILDALNNQVQIFDSTGHYLTQFGAMGSDAGYFFNPKGITVDSLGEIFVVDSGNRRISKFAYDTTVPVVSITNPANASTVRGSVTLSGSFSDNVAVASAQFKVDGSFFGGPSSISPYSVVWDSTGVSAGSHTISLIVTDTSSNVATANTTVTVDNSPPASSGVTVGGSSYFSTANTVMYNPPVTLPTTIVQSVSTSVPPVSVTPSFVFKRDLQLANTGNDVKALQQYLNNHGFKLANKGPGSPGNETMIFGYATRAALIRFQKANNIKPSVGYFGPITRAFIKVN